MRRLILVIPALLLLAACSGQRALPAPPVDQYENAEVAGFPGIRTWGDVPFPNAGQRVRELVGQIQARVATEGTVPNGGKLDVLILSGGGSDGAFGAGLLNGWSDAGGRPEFTLVTGISTGALIAPYVFAGTDYDGELERFYTNTSTDDILSFDLIDLVFGRRLGASDTSLLIQTLDRTLNPELVARIAEEHMKGRRLLVGTTNLDAQRPVTWDLGAIAASGRPDAPRLMRDVLLASASIPGAFPPVLFRVEADGRQYSEMHLDGGVIRQLFWVPPQLRDLDISALLKMGLRPGTLYAVRNTKLAPSYQPVEPSVLPIAARAVSTLIKAAGVADVEVVTKQGRDIGFAVKVTAVPGSFNQPEGELFDPVYMRALFETGYNLATKGDPWDVVVSEADLERSE